MDNLIIQTAFLGDLILAIPLMRETALAFPESQLTVVCRKGLGGLIEGLSFVDRVIEVDKKNPSFWRQQKRELAKEEFSIVLCPHRSPRSAMLVRGLRAQQKIGFQLWWNSLFFRTRVLQPLHLPDALRQLSLLAAASDRFADQYSEVTGVPGLTNSVDKVEAVNFNKIYLPHWSRLQYKDLRPLSLKSPIAKMILLSPGSTWPTKKWTQAGFVKLARELLAQGEKVAIVGSPEERGLAEEMASLAAGAEVFAGQWSLLETVHHYRQAKAMVANDSGAIHMAALAELPTVAVFGPTTLDLGFRPWQANAVVVQRNLKCRPCGKHGHQVCPIGTHACMKEVTVDSVFENLNRLLQTVEMSAAGS